MLKTQVIGLNPKIVMTTVVPFKLKLRLYFSLALYFYVCQSFILTINYFLLVASDSARALGAIFICIKEIYVF